MHGAESDVSAHAAHLGRVLRHVQDADPAQHGNAQVFFHNGVFHSLADVIDFYNTRDTNPAAWYPTVKGVVQKIQ